MLFEGIIKIRVFRPKEIKRGVFLTVEAGDGGVSLSCQEVKSTEASSLQVKYVCVCKMVVRGRLLGDLELGQAGSMRNWRAVKRAVSGWVVAVFLVWCGVVMVVLEYAKPQRCSLMDRLSSPVAGVSLARHGTQQQKRRSCQFVR